jgi:hypothetical protein
MIPDCNVVNWIISPAGNCIKYVAEETFHASILHKAIINLSGMTPFIQIARQHFIKHGKDDTQLKILQKENEFLEQKAKELIVSNFHSINAHGLIGLWCALETAVEDTIVLILIKDLGAIDSLVNAGYKVKPKFAPNMSEYDARNLYSNLENQSRQSLTVGEGYCKLLSVFGLNIELSNKETEILAEINAVRNCILHRGGLIDDKAIRDSKRLIKFHNKELNITNELYMEYYDTVSKFAYRLLTSAIESNYTKNE